LQLDSVKTVRRLPLYGQTYESGKGEVNNRSHENSLTWLSPGLGPLSPKIVTPPTWLPEDFININTSDEVRNAKLWRTQDHPRIEEFIREDIPGQIAELFTELHLLQAKIAWLGKRWKDMNNAIMEANLTAEKVNFPPLDAKVSFYRAIWGSETKDWKTFAESLFKAEPTRKIFREGELLDRYHEILKLRAENATVGDDVSEILSEIAERSGMSDTASTNSLEDELGSEMDED
jgi:hypothetical protein